MVFKMLLSRFWNQFSGVSPNSNAQTCALDGCLSRDSPKCHRG